MVDNGLWPSIPSPLLVAELEASVDLDTTAEVELSATFFAAECQDDSGIALHTPEDDENPEAPQELFSAVLSPALAIGIPNPPEPTRFGELDTPTDPLRLASNGMNAKDPGYVQGAAATGEFYSDDHASGSFYLHTPVLDVPLGGEVQTVTNMLELTSHCRTSGVPNKLPITSHPDHRHLQQGMLNTSDVRGFAGGQLTVPATHQIEASAYEHFEDLGTTAPVGPALLPQYPQTTINQSSRPPASTNIADAIAHNLSRAFKTALLPPYVNREVLPAACPPSVGSAIHSGSFQLPFPAHGMEGNIEMKAWAWNAQRTSVPSQSNPPMAVHLSPAVKTAGTNSQSQTAPPSGNHFSAVASPFSAPRESAPGSTAFTVRRPESFPARGMDPRYSACAKEATPSQQVAYPAQINGGFANNGQRASMRRHSYHVAAVTPLPPPPPLVQIPALPNIPLPQQAQSSSAQIRPPPIVTRQMQPLGTISAALPFNPADSRCASNAYTHSAPRTSTPQFQGARIAQERVFTRSGRVPCTPGAWSGQWSKDNMSSNTGIRLSGSGHESTMAGPSYGPCVPPRYELRGPGPSTYQPHMDQSAHATRISPEKGGRKRTPGSNFQPHAPDDYPVVSDHHANDGPGNIDDRANADDDDEDNYVFSESSRRKRKPLSFVGTSQKPSKIRKTQTQLVAPDRPKKRRSPVDPNRPRPFPCGFPGCEQRCFSISDRKRHRGTHGADPANTCSSCGVPFSRRDALVRHVRTGAPSCRESYESRFGSLSK